MMLTNTEYMSDKARADRVVRKLMNLKFKEFRTPQNERYIDFIAEEIISREDLSETKVQNMSYIEFACLVDRIGGNSRYDWEDHDSWSEQLFYFMCVGAALMNGSRESIPIRLFTALPLRAFYAHLNRNRDPRGHSLLSEYRRITECCQYNKDYTIMDFLSEKMKVINTAWKPLQPLAEYQKKITDAHRDIGSLLIGSFHLAFPDKFRAEDIWGKYSDFIDFPDDIPFDDEFECGEASADSWQQRGQENKSEPENNDNSNRKEGN